MMQKAVLVGLGLVVGAGAGWFLSRGSGHDVDAEAAARGRTIFQSCTVCHGERGEGNPDTQAPMLAGQYPWYIERQLLNFRAGLRGVDSTDLNGLVMRPMAVGLANDQAVSDVAAYIGTLRP